MSPRHQLRIANILIGIGVLPLALVLCWITAFFLTAVRGQAPKVPIIDPIGMIGLLVMSFIITLVMAGISALWSWSLTTRNTEIRSRAALTFRLVTALVLIAPFLLSYYLSIRPR
jgi:hypothetical protein